MQMCLRMYVCIYNILFEVLNSFLSCSGTHIQTDDEIDAFVRECGDSGYHPSCTCKMGHEDDPMSVVDSQTRVKGFENLRIVDASIMPSIVSGNLTGPVIMMAEKAADIIKGDKLPRSNAPIYSTVNTER